MGEGGHPPGSAEAAKGPGLASAPERIGQPRAEASPVRLIALAVGAAALGGLGVWLYLRASTDPQQHASHRIEDLRQRLDRLAGEFARYAAVSREGPAESARS